MNYYPKLKEALTILIVGLENGGKTALLKYLVQNDEEYLRRLTFPFPSVSNQNYNICFNIYDLGRKKNN